MSEFRELTKDEAEVCAAFAIPANQLTVGIAAHRPPEYVGVCAQCGQPASFYDADFEAPFCSETCKGMAWAKENFTTGDAL